MLTPTAQTPAEASWIFSSTFHSLLTVWVLESCWHAISIITKAQLSLWNWKKHFNVNISIANISLCAILLFYCPHKGLKWQDRVAFPSYIFVFLSAGSWMACGAEKSIFPSDYFHSTLVCSLPNAFLSFACLVNAKNYWLSWEILQSGPTSISTFFWNWPVWTSLSQQCSSASRRALSESPLNRIRLIGGLWDKSAL